MPTNNKTTGIFTKAVSHKEGDRSVDKIFALNTIEEKIEAILAEAEQKTNQKIKRPKITVTHKDEAVLHDSFQPRFTIFNIKYGLFNRTQKYKTPTINLKGNINNLVDNVCAFALKNHPQKEEIIKLEMQSPSKAEELYNTP